MNLADASMLNKLSPFFAVIFSLFILKEKANFTGNCGISFNAAVCTFEVSADGSVKLLEPWNCNHIPLEKVTSNKRSYEEVMAEV
jgi:hypothetical protein